MDLNPPIGSEISIRQDGAGPVIVVPAKGAPSRYFGGVFLIFWLGGWAFGFKSALTTLLSGQGNAFIVFWLGAWTVGGILAAYSVFRIFRPGVPETFVLRRNGIDYDSGIPPLELNSYRRGSSLNSWRSIFSKRLQTELGRQQLQSLRLRETEAGNRLTVDVDAKRVDLASQASEVEREWLARLLANRYALPQVMPGVADRT
ncbi:hypothetical protein [Bradyrhizobium canariense]|uniref:hypothetical protein n=1 Tax=Bradyrhizobium canariense TaxID=255045 RepID=UPI001B8A30C2|nr:hypothetical protein [Bradyrhizobium canariense]MBR0953931.1 hypothetical protein [Bradyrhizobium canariense]